MTALAITAAAVAVVWITRLAVLPFGPCPACRGRKGRGLGSSARAFRKCGRCDGAGERIRPGARTIRRAIGRPLDKEK